MADYNIAMAGGAGIATDAPIDSGLYTDGEKYYNIGLLRRQYYDYLGVKMNEIEEQKEARRYYHGAQWTDKEIKVLRRRRQPVIVSNRIVRKIDAVTGLVERLRQDPKAYPRTPQHQQGADVATATLRYALDHVDWKAKSPRVARFAAIEGIGGIEFDLSTGDHGDPDLDIHLVYTDTFFYDPRSYDDGFTDARFLGVSKWVDIDQAKELVPEKAEEINGLIETGTDLTPNSDREITWVNTSAKKVRLIDHWYIKDGQWNWCLYVGNTVLMEGMSPFVDERNRTFPKFLMFSAAVDHDGDRYGFVRNLKGPQDEINHRRSKSLHILNARRVISDKGAVDDVERARLEWSRPDGWVEKNPGKQIEPENQQGDFTGQIQLLQEAKTEIENFGPNPALIGQGIENSSGRAISLLQQAGIAELGPYIIAYRTWKIRVYRAIWQIIQRHWTAERWIRVTDDDGLAQFVQLNGVGLDQYGQPAIVNGVGSLDVDIILDEGPDNVNMMADGFDTLTALARSGQPIPPEILFELAPLQSSVKQRLLQKMEQMKQADPAKLQAQQIALQGEAAKTEETKSKTAKNYSDAMKTLHDGRMDAQQLLAAGMAPPAAPGAPSPTEPPFADGGGAPGVFQPPTNTPQPVAAPANAPQSPVAIHLDANDAVGRAMMPLTGAMQQNSDAIVAALQMMSQVAQSMNMASQSMEEVARGVNEMARVVAAPSELLRDPATGRATGSRKVI